MTTRDATGLLTRRPDASHDALALSLVDRLTILAFGAIQWPWLLRSLSGGHLADKQALLARLDLPADALPHLGSWKADTRLLQIIVDRIAATSPAHVVELGAGASSFVIARALQRHGGGRLTSYDQHGDFVVATSAWLLENGLEADMHAVPLVPSPAPWPGHWYAVHDVPAAIDLLVIDGPPWTVHPLVRGAADCLFHRIVPGGMVLLDDGARPGERIVMQRWIRRWPDFTFHRDKRGTKGTVIGIRRSAG